MQKESEPTENGQKNLLYNLGNRQWDIPELRKLLEDILPNNSQVRNFLVKHDFQRIGYKKMLLNAGRVAIDEGQTHRILLSIEDVTDIEGLAPKQAGVHEAG